MGKARKIYLILLKPWLAGPLTTATSSHCRDDDLVSCRQFYSKKLLQPHLCDESNDLPVIYRRDRDLLEAAWQTIKSSWHG